MKDNNKDIKQHIVHPFEPIIDAHSRVLILGSLPSVKSREEGFYYGHPQNRFWRVISMICGCEVPSNISEKRELLVRNNIALYDSIVECDIYGSSDASIENAVPANIEAVIAGTDIGIIYCNGSTSYNIFKKYNSSINVPVVCLPSTSPANATWKLSALACAWGRVGRYLKRMKHLGDSSFDKYYSLNSFIRDNYDMKLYKTPVDGGFTCPNRDGTKGIGGCIFCDNEGSGHFTGVLRPKTSYGDGGSGSRLSYEDKGSGSEIIEKDDSINHNSNGIGDNSITAQIARGKKLVASKMPANGRYGYIAYFQAYTSTYAPAERLRELYEEAIADSEVKILSIATRPDCLGKEVLELLHEIAARIPVWVELGLQTSNADSYVQINRCYDNNVYLKAVTDLHKAGVEHVITHIILGLPGESEKDMLESVRFACEAGTDGIKLQLLHVLKGTKLADMYSNGEFEVLGLEEYTEIVRHSLQCIPPDVVVHRITGDGDKNKLIAPMWSADKKRVLNYMNRNL